MIQGVWMHEREKAVIEKYLNPEVTMMEWGSGGSTVEFSKKVKKYYSVEHNLEWYNQVKQAVPSNVTLYYKENKPLPDEYSQAEYQHYGLFSVLWVEDSDENGQSKKKWISLGIFATVFMQIDQNDL